MKIKKWKELLTGIALVGAITPAISLSVNKNNTTQTTTSLSVLKNTSSKTTVDYSLVEKMMSNLTPKLLRSNLSENKLTPEQEQKARELQEQYLNLFKTNNYSLEEIQSYMCENFPQYKEEYEKQTTSLNKVECVQKTTLTKKIDPSEPLDPNVVVYLKSELKDKLPSLETQRNVLIGFCSAYSIAAAGFYAAAFWTFGATLPWAVACTIGSLQTGITQDAVYKQIVLINNFIDTNFYETYNLIQDIINIKNILNWGLGTVFRVVEVIIDCLVSSCPPVVVISNGVKITISIIIECIDAISSHIKSLV